MPFALLFVGIIIFVVAYQGTQNQFYNQLKQDFTGQHNFLIWIVAIGIIGALGYIDELKKPSDLFLALIIVVMLLSNKGIIANLNSQITGGSASNAVSSPQTFTSNPLSTPLSQVTL